MLDIMEYINLAIIIMFGLEILIKIFGFGFKHYSNNVWNVMDAFIVTISLLLSLLSLVLDPSIRTFSYPFQIIRIMVSFKKMKILRKIIYTLSCIIPQAGSIAMILFIIMLIYMYLGVDIFAYTKPQSVVGGLILNFRNVNGAFQALIRTTTGESWYMILADVSRRQSPNFACKDIFSYADYKEFGLVGCGSPFAIVYFISFHLIISIFILNLFIAMLLSASEELAKIEESSITRYQLNDILKVWKRYDPEADGFVSYKMFWKLSSELAIIFNVPVEHLMDVDAMPLCSLQTATEETSITSG